MLGFRKLRSLSGLLVLALAVPSIHAQTSRTINNSGVGRMTASSPGTDTLRERELSPLSELEDGEALDAASAFAKTNAQTRIVDRTIARRPGRGDHWQGKEWSRLNPRLVTSFDGITHRQQRLANGGNQFSSEPPDQGLCVGNGYILESVNTALRVYSANGTPLIGTVDLNTFYGYPAAINRSTGLIGPIITDPSCLFDKQTQRWFHVVLTLDTDPTTGDFLGSNHLDLAVSKTANPLGEWNIYQIPVQNDGTQGTPDHNCPGGPCLGDYPHIGADRYGIYLTTNEFPFFAPGFHGAQIYAISKAALARGATNITLFQFDTANTLFEGNPGFTVWPAQSPNVPDYDGKEYFLSSLAVFNDSETDNRLRIWALNNTDSLNSRKPKLQLASGVVNTLSYSVPPPADQKPGNFPLGECINDTTIPTPFGPGCWQFLFVQEPAHDEVEYALDSNDSRMQQVFFADGKLYGALDTAVTVNNEEKAGVAYFIIEPHAGFGWVSGRVKKQEVLSLAQNNLTYPAIAALDDGRAVIAFTVTGADYYPSAGYVGVDPDRGAGDVQIAAAGLGPADGFSGYKAFGDPPRPRWGDYGAAATDGNAIWIASEYIGQTCTLEEYVATPFGSCGGTRTSLANWYTRISKVIPGRER